MDPYCPLVAHTRLPDNANLVAPKGGAAGSMPINMPQVPLSSLAFLLDDFTFKVDSPGCDTVLLLPMMHLEWSLLSSYRPDLKVVWVHMSSLHIGQMVTKGCSTLAQCTKHSGRRCHSVTMSVLKPWQQP